MWGDWVIVSVDLDIVLAALLLEALWGYPDRLFRAIAHPVVWIGGLIDLLERRCNRGRLRRLRGGVALAVLVAAALGSGWAIQAALLAGLPRGLALPALGLVAGSLLAQRSLWRHVTDVALGLEDGLAAGRLAVARIVGRNPETLDAAAVARAAIESLAENFADGVVAPALWCAALGLPGILFYKAVNTADSMIGHRTERFARFGWAAARLDDVINLPASRLAALWIVLAAWLHGHDARGAMRAVWRDAGRHRSPNAGWPEAAMAGALGLRLAGPRVYGVTRVDDSWMGDGRAEADVRDLGRALALYRTACALQTLAATILFAVIWRD